MPSGRDLRAVIERVERGIVAKASDGSISGYMIPADEWRELRAILAEHPATPAEGVHTACARRVEWGLIRYACGVDVPLGTPNAYAEHVRRATTPAEPDAGGEGLTEVEVSNIRAVRAVGSSRQLLALVERLLADRERRAEVRGAERALREAADDIKSRIAVFRDLNADPEYLNALNDAWGLVMNRYRSADRIAGEGQ